MTAGTKRQGWGWLAWSVLLAVGMGCIADASGQDAGRDVPPAARASFEEGSRYLKEGRVEQGIASLREAIRICPTYFDAQFALATELGRRDDRIEEALAALEQARRLRDRDPRVYFLFGTLMARQNKFAVAELAFREAIDRDPMNPQSYFSHGLALIELAIRKTARDEAAARAASLKEAERDLNRALILSGRTMCAAYLQLARAAEHRGDRPAAAAMLETYLKCQPDDKNAAAIRQAIDRLRR